MRWIVLAAAIAFSVAALYLLRGESPRSAMLRRPDPAKTGLADPGETALIFAAGIVEGLQSPLELRFETTGRVKAVRVREGDAVRANQVLADLEPDASKLRVTQAKAQLQIAIAEKDRLAVDKGTAGNASQAGRGNASGQDGNHRLASNVSMVSKEDEALFDARIVAAETAVMQEQLLLGKTRLVAPIDGTVLTMMLKEGELVGPASESNFIAIVNRGRTRVRAFVEELDAMDVAAGQEAFVTAAGRTDRKYRGTILSCAPYVRPKSHRHSNPGERLDVRVREIVVELDDGADLLVGLPVEVFITKEGVAASGRPAPKRAPAGKRADSSSRK